MPASSKKTPTSAGKSVQARHSVARKTAAQRSTTKKTAAKKSTAKKTAAKKTTAKKSTARKTAAKKTTAKESAAKKTAAKGAEGKKSTVSKAGPKESTARKVTTERTGTRKPRSKPASGGTATDRSAAPGSQTRKTPSGKRSLQKVSKSIRFDYFHEKLLESQGGAESFPPIDDNLDLLILSHLSLQMPLAEAKSAFLALKTQFVDWNEVRISSAVEVREALKGAPEPLALAIFLKDFLGRLFIEQHHVGLEFLRDKSNPEIRAFFKKHPGFAESTVGLILERVNEYPVVPLESFAMAFLARVGLGSPEATPLSKQKDLYARVPREQVARLSMLIHEHARAVCPPSEGDLDCPSCALKRECPYPAKVTPRQRSAALRAARSK